MSVVVMPGQIQRLLIQRSRHGTIHLVSHRQLDGLLDILEGGVATLGLYLAELKRREVDALQVNDIDGAVLELGVLDALDGVDLQVEAQQLNGLLHNSGIASNNGLALLVSLFSVQGANGNLRTDACGVAHRDG